MQVGKLLIAPNRFPLLLIVIRIPSKNLPSSRPSQVSKRRGTKRPKELLPLPEGPTITKNSPGPTHFLAKHMKCPKNEGIHGNPPFGSYSWTSLDFEVGKDQMPSCCLETFQKILQEDTPKNLETSVSTSCLELPHKFRSLFWTCLKHAKYALDSSPNKQFIFPGLLDELAGAWRAPQGSIIESMIPSPHIFHSPGLKMFNKIR